MTNYVRYFNLELLYANISQLSLCVKCYSYVDDQHTTLQIALFWDFSIKGLTKGCLKSNGFHCTKKRFMCLKGFQEVF